jgi:hypothetical protein
VAKVGAACDGAKERQGAEASASGHSRR